MKDWVKIGKISAFFAPLSFITLTAIAIFNYPGYNIYSNFLSDLGIGEKSASFFNLAVIVAGISSIVFSAALHKIFHKIPLCRVGSITLAFGAIFLICVGIFTENYPILHTISAVLFFASLSITMLTFGVALHKITKTGNLFIIAGLAIPAFFYAGITPLAEHIAVGFIMLWSLGVGVYLKDIKS